MDRDSKEEKEFQMILKACHVALKGLPSKIVHLIYRCESPRRFAFEHRDLKESEFVFTVGSPFRSERFARNLNPGILELRTRCW